MKHYKIFLLNIILLASIGTINASTGGFIFSNQTDSNVIVSNFSTLGELDDDPTLFYKDTCYTWEKDSNTWSGSSTITIPPYNSFGIGLTDRNLLHDSQSILNITVNNEPKTVAFTRTATSGAWNIGGDYLPYVTACPTNDTILECLNYPNNGCQGVTFKASANKKVPHKKSLENIQEKK